MSEISKPTSPIRPLSMNLKFANKADRMRGGANLMGNWESMMTDAIVLGKQIWVDEQTWYPSRTKKNSLDLKNVWNQDTQIPSVKVHISKKHSEKIKLVKKKSSKGKSQNLHSKTSSVKIWLKTNL